MSRQKLPLPISEMKIETRDISRSQRSLYSIIRMLGALLLIFIFTTFTKSWHTDYLSLSLLDSYEHYSNFAIASLQAAVQTHNDFPRYIWQTDRGVSNETFVDQKDSWTRMNPEWLYRIVHEGHPDVWVESHFGTHNPSLANFFHDLYHPVARSSLLRYLIMLSNGGVYTEADTTCAKPIEEWLPSSFRKGRVVNAVIGLAYNDNTDPQFVRPNSFAEWTLMAKPGHAIFEAVVERMMHNLEFLARMQQTTLSQLELTEEEISEATGTGAFTDAVIEVLRAESRDPSLDVSMFDGMSSPTLVGDVLILPVNAFASGQKWEEVNPEFGDVLVEHEFARSRFELGEEKLEKGQPGRVLVEEDSLPPGAE